MMLKFRREKVIEIEDSPRTNEVINQDAMIMIGNEYTTAIAELDGN